MFTKYEDRVALLRRLIIETDEEIATNVEAARRVWPRLRTMDFETVLAALRAKSDQAAVTAWSHFG